MGCCIKLFWKKVSGSMATVHGYLFKTVFPCRSPSNMVGARGRCPTPITAQMLAPVLST